MFEYKPVKCGFGIMVPKNDPSFDPLIYMIKDWCNQQEKKGMEWLSKSVTTLGKKDAQ